MMRMNSARKAAKVTLLSTILAAALGLALGLVSTPVQAHCPHKGSTDHVHCDGGGTIEYTAKLTGGGFAFDTISVIANSKEDLLTPSINVGVLTLFIPDSDDHESVDHETWEQVFNDCPELLKNSDMEGFVQEFSIGNTQLRINKAGGVRVLFVNILFDEEAPGVLDPTAPAEVTVQLVGNEFDFVDSFLPEPGDDNTREYDLVGYRINGGTLKGIHPRSGCKVQGSGTPDIIVLDSPSTLTITATASTP